MAAFLTPERVRAEIKTRTTRPLKYVRMADGTLRFIDVLSNFSHADVVAPGESAVSAGIIGIDGDAFAIFKRGSDTLRIGAREDDADVLAAALGLRHNAGLP